jgi:hypothetical protein
VSARDGRPVNEAWLNEPARVYRICAPRASGAPMAAIRHDVKTSATRRFIWGALASVAPSGAALRRAGGRRPA